LLWTDSLQIWHIYVTASVGSIANAFQRPAYTAAIAQLVPKRYLGKVNGIVQLGGAAGRLIAPLLGGVLVIAVGPYGIVLIDLATFLFAVTTLLFVRFPDTLFKQQEEPLLQEMVKGWRFIIKRQGLMAMVVFFVVTNYFFGILNVLITPLVLSFGTPTALGTVMAANGIGLLIGSLVMGLWGGTKRRAEGMVGFIMLFGLSALVIGARPLLIYPTIGLFGLGLSLALVNAHWQTIIQTKVGLELQGRVQATNQMLAWSMIPLGYITAGPLADEIFEPLMARDGPLAASIGRLIGSGPGRGMGLLMILVGLIVLVWAILGYKYRPLRFMEDELPDAIPDAVIVADKDKLQELADRRLLPETVKR
jgi:MFS family permease